MNEDERPEVDSERPTVSRPADATGQTIAGYRVLQVVGEGGMGVVYEAEQEQPVRRRVALKLIKPGMDTGQVVARFESERQALALMSHPTIASIYDGGATDDGRPYFAMELVHGEPLTQYCDKNRLTIKERLELFIQVCEGVQHAHQKGIIHRDLKPSNILVTIRDEMPVPKIIDFGVAKATSQRLTDKTLYTQLGQWMGTPVYMSPEQAEMTGIDVDTRADVYSLGVVLYELLAGALPFDPTELKKAGFEGFARFLRETEPKKPSTKVHTLTKTPANPAATRRLAMPGLEKELRGDLDWITMKALEKDRNRRYGSPSELAQDIRRHLSHEPVQASPPSVVYRLRKFVRRHRVGVAAGAAVVLALVLGIVAATVGLVRAQRAEALAYQEAERARHEAEAAKQVSDFLVELFKVSDPDEARGNTVTAREVLDRGAEKIGEQLRDQPLVQARLMHTMSRVYDSMGLYDEADTLGQQALETREGILGGRHADVASTLSLLGSIRRKEGRYSESEAFLRRALAIRESELGANDPLVATTLNRLAIVVAIQGDLEESESLLKRALAIKEKALGEQDPGTLRTLHDLAAVYGRQGKMDEAEPLFLRFMEDGQKTLAPDDPLLGFPAVSLGIIYKERSELEKAERFLNQGLGIWEKAYGPEHPNVANALRNLATLYRLQGRYDDAETAFLRALAIQRRALGEDHTDLALTLWRLAGAYQDQDREAEAEECYRRALEIYERAFEASHPSVLGVLEEYAAFLKEAGREAEAASLLARHEVPEETSSR